MSELLVILTKALQVLVLLLLPPLLLGVINKTKALVAGRVGPPLLQGYYDLAKLMRKDSLTSRTTTWVFIAGPPITLVAMFLAGLFVPIGPHPAVVGFSGDFIVFAYFFALARFFVTSAALDTGSAFEGMGAARDVTFACFAEVTLFFCLLALANLSHSTSLSGMFGPLNAEAQLVATAPVVLVVAGMSVLLLAENSRIPVDDPNTHLELTMIHEVMILEHSGPALGVILYAASLKLFILSTLVTSLVLPAVTNPALGWLAFLVGILVLAILIGLVESFMARLRMSRVPALLIAASLLAGFGFLLGVA